MKAIRVFIDEEENFKIPNLVEKMNSNEDIAMIAVGLGEFVIATIGDCTMAYVMAIIKGKFNDCSIETIK